MIGGSGARALLIVTVLVGLAARSVWIDRIPGINGDEAWYAVNVNEWLRGGTPFFQTPSGNIVNPVHSFPVLLASFVVPPSFAVLRAPEVWWGGLTLLLSYPLLAAPLGRRAAILVTVLLALSPTAIAYARLGWDPSGTPFVSLLAIAAALRNRPIALLASLAAAYIVHPTNIFLMPFAIAAWLPHGYQRYRAAPLETRKRLLNVSLILSVLALPLGALLVTSVARMGRLPSIEMVIERLTSPGVWADVGLSLIRLISGVTATVYVAGPMPASATMVADSIALVVVLLAVGTVVSGAFRGRVHPGGERQSIWLLTGLVASVLVFHVVAGSVAIEPGLERYAISLVVPLVIVCAVGLDMCAQVAPRVALVSALGLCVASIGVVGGGYFYPLLTRGGDAHPTFRTGHEEPKAAALHYIRAAAGDDEVVAVFAEDWWIYWPTRYLAFPDRDWIFVEMLGHTPPIYPPDAARPAYPRPPAKVFAVVFDGSAAWGQVKGLGPVVFTARDPIQRPILHVVHISPETTLPFADPPPWAGSPAVPLSDR